MAEVIAKLKHGNKEFEILVDLDKAIDFKQGKPVEIRNVLAFDKVFTDVKKGMHASEADMKSEFKTTDVYQVAEQIIKKGTVQLTAEYRQKLRDAKVKQIVAFLSRNCIDPQTNLPHPPLRIENAIDEASVKIDEFKSVDDQIQDIIKELQKVLPIRIEFKKLAVRIPAEHTGKAYSALKEYMTKEEWQSDGSLIAICELPAGLQMEFYNKINSLTHGSAETKEIKGQK
ncbi:MAG TPA: ribosome assembly factor SBDS [Nanoarchaeota archaeon]|nr:ribosome assembly factor SBDS [Candidatus Pacearchaeota archaeon]HIH18193.1 ribosome assembly factor SBDS [Nanoarchaeota archaeon]HIH34570.1 ribosome assembly factor SBDS [Nanoarchaeota archaeon]HIH51856.1 ribosome assembly factor SBDS [Nanoarchaeota archaeon]HIH66555.1 ribosome assembly factor SBDS [Nanoarchaeota archaeon]